MHWKKFVPAVAVLSVALLSPVDAKLCGDNVAGNDIACDCGDLVVSDTVLGNDPVTGTTCSGDGLVIRATSGDRGLTLDLRGATLRGGTRGAGIAVAYGGRGGARIISTGGSANIVGFRDGIQAHGQDAVNMISGLIITEPARDGVRINGGRRARVSDVTVIEAGRNGFWLSGQRFRLRKTRTFDSKRTGYLVMGENSTLGAPGSGVVARGSGDIGFKLMGGGHRLVDCVAEAGAKSGVDFTASRVLIHGCRAIGNGKHGITGIGGRLRLARNRADENEGNGIQIHGHHIQDLGGNKGELNRGATSEVAPTVQCEIGGAPCI